LSVPLLSFALAGLSFLLHSFYRQSLDLRSVVDENN